VGVTAGAATRRLVPSRGLRAQSPRELWRYRELLFFLVVRDIKLRYKQTLLGAAWAILQPLMTMIVFTVFFGRLARIPSDGVPYPIFAMAALVPWTYFSTAVAGGSASLGAYQHIISKVYFPRLLIPMAAVIAPLVDMLIAFLMLLVLMVVYGAAPGAAIVWLPALLLLAIATALATSIWLAALTVRYRDVRFVVPFALQLWMFATPVAYPASLVPERWRVLLYGLNPMAGVIEGFRWALVGGPPPGAMTFASAFGVTALLAAGIMYFRSFEGTFVDVI
jgi:lipopolysaccharide transport system permease protein